MTTFKYRQAVSKLLSLILVIPLLAAFMCLGSTGASADEDTDVLSYGYFNYVVDKDGVCITEYTGDGGDVSIPNMIDDMSVIAIGEEAFWFCDEVTAIDMPEYLEYIGARAFQGCKSLVTVSLPDSVIEIGDAAFESCSNLVSVNIPAQLMYVGNAAFDNTLWITRFEDNDSIILGGRIFYKYSGSADMVTIPSGVTGISANAFAGNQNLTYVSIPETVMFIGDYAFYNCPKLQSASIPDGVYYMGAYSFGYNTINQDGSGNIVDSFVLYANQDTLGEDYAKEYGLEYKPRGKNPTPDELPEAELCVAKDMISTADSIGNGSGWLKNQNSVITLIIIVVSCVVIIGGLYLYFAITEKKTKAEKKSQKNSNKKSKKKKK